MSKLKVTISFHSHQRDVQHSYYHGDAHGFCFFDHGNMAQKKVPSVHVRQVTSHSHLPNG